MKKCFLFPFIILMISLWGNLCLGQKVLTPIPISFDEQLLSTLSPTQKEILEKLAQDLGQLTHWKEYNVQLPSSDLLDNDLTPSLNFSHLFMAPSASEVADLAYNAQGEHIYLNKEQLKEIKNLGTFSVPSQKYEGQQHVWKVAFWLQKGRKNIHITLEKDLANSAEAFLVRIPNDLHHTKYGLHNLYKGLQGVARILIGLPEYKEQQDFDKKLPDIIKERQRESLQSGEAFDDRLFDPSVQEIARPYLKTIQNRVDSKIKTLQDRGPLQNDLLFDEELIKDQELEEALPGFGQLLLNQRQATRIAQMVEQELMAQVEDYRKEVTLKYEKDHTILSRVHSLKTKQIEEDVTKYYDEKRWEVLGKIPEILQNEGLLQEAALYQMVLNIKHDEYKELKKNYLQQHIPAKTFEYDIKMWNSNNWTTTEENGHYSLKSYQTNSVSTDRWGWRVLNAYYFSKWSIKNGAYHLLMSNLINGPLGIRALFSLKDEFSYGKSVDHKTGETTSLGTTSTLKGHIKDSISYIRGSRKAFESAPDTGLLGKHYTRLLNIIWNYGFKGLLGIPLQIGLQIGGTAANTLLSGVALATVPVWGPLTGLVMMGFDATVYDTHAAHGKDPHFLPFIQYIVGKAGFRGLLKSAYNLGMATTVHPAQGIFYAGYGKFSQVAHTFYDTVAFTAFKNLTRVPASNSWTAKRIAGPGISSNYFFQIKPDMALIGLQAHLESYEVEMFATSSRQEILAPLNNYKNYLSTLFGPLLDLSFSSKTAVYSDLSKETDQYLKDLDHIVLERKNNLRKVQSISHHSSAIKQSEKDLKETLEKGTLIVEEFFKNHLENSYSEQELGRLWSGASLRPNDYQGMAKYLLTNLFGQNFLIPLEINDENFIINVEDPRLSDLVKHILH